MASNTAEHFVVTNEIGGSTTGERAALIASVISGAATLTATNTAVYSAADAEELVASQTFRLTTSLNNFSGGAGDDTISGGTGTTGLDTRSGSFSIDSFSFLNTLAAASLASVHRSAPHFLKLDADRCPLVTREHNQNGYPEFFN